MRPTFGTNQVTDSLLDNGDPALISQIVATGSGINPITSGSGAVGCSGDHLYLSIGCCIPAFHARIIQNRSASPHCPASMLGIEHSGLLGS